MPNTYQRTLSLKESYSLSNALDFISRMGIGQIDRISDLARMEGAACLKNGKLEPASPDEWSTLESITDHVSRFMGYPRGGSYGIGHTYVSQVAHRAWEIKKVIDLALAMNRDKSPSFRTVDYDGLMLRYTKDPAPEAEISGEANEALLTLSMTPDQLAVVNKAMDLMVSLYSGDYQAITRLAEEGILIPFDEKDQFGRKKYEGKPKASADQLSTLKECMAAYSSVMGFKSKVNLNDYDLPNNLKTAVDAQSKIKGANAPKGQEPSV